MFFREKRKIFPAWNFSPVRAGVRVCVCVRASGMLSREIFLFTNGGRKKARRVDEKKLFQSWKKSIVCWCCIGGFFPFYVRLLMCVCVCARLEEAFFPSSNERKHFIFILRKKFPSFFCDEVVYKAGRTYIFKHTYVRTRISSPQRVTSEMEIKQASHNAFDVESMALITPRLLCSAPL